MVEYIYLYSPQGYSPGYAFRDFDRAVAMLLKDENEQSVSTYIELLDENDCWHDIDLEAESFSVDDGPSITKVELL